MIDTVINAIVTRLAAKLPEIPVKAWDDVTDYVNRSESMILVHFQGEKADKPKALGCIVQDVKLDIGIAVLTKSLSAENNSASAYSLINAVKKALNGFEITDEKMFYQSSKLVSFEAGRFVFGMSFLVPGVIVEESDEITSPLLKEYFFKKEE